MESQSIQESKFDPFQLSHLEKRGLVMQIKYDKGERTYLRKIFGDYYDSIWDHPKKYVLKDGRIFYFIEPYMDKLDMNLLMKFFQVCKENYFDVKFYNSDYFLGRTVGIQVFKLNNVFPIEEALPSFIGPNTLEKMKKANIMTTKDLIETDFKILAEEVGVSDSTIRKLKESVLEFVEEHVNV